MKFWRIAALLLVLSICAAAQQIKMPAGLENLAPKASEVVDINLDKKMLQFASRFMNDPSDAEARKMISGLNGIYVRSYEFDKPGQYSEADIASVRTQLQGSAWSKMVDVKSRRDGENAEVYFKTDANGIAGMVIIAAEPRQLTIVNIDGPITPEQLESLGGNFGVPKVKARPSTATNR